MNSLLLLPNLETLDFEVRTSTFKQRQQQTKNTEQVNGGVTCLLCEHNTLTQQTFSCTLHMCLHHIVAQGVASSVS